MLPRYNIITYMESMGKKLIELRIATRSACNFEHGRGSGVTLRTKILYLLDQGARSPIELIEKLCMVKSNLAILCNKMVEDGVIAKSKHAEDKRIISYNITDKGREELNRTLETLDEKFKGVLTTEKEFENAGKVLDEAVDLLSFI